MAMSKPEIVADVRTMVQTALDETWERMTDLEPGAYTDEDRATFEAQRKAIEAALPRLRIGPKPRKVAGREIVPASFYVATFGDMGLEVQLFDDPLAYGRAVKEAKTDWERGYRPGMGDVDSYTMGACEVWK